MRRQDIVNIINIIESQKQTDDIKLIKHLLEELVKEDEKLENEMLDNMYEDYLDSMWMPSNYCADDVPF